MLRLPLRDLHRAKSLGALIGEPGAAIALVALGLWGLFGVQNLLLIKGLFALTLLACGLLLVISRVRNHAVKEIMTHRSERAFAAMQREKDQMHVLLEHTPIGIFSIQEDLEILSDYSRHLEIITGQTQLGGKSFVDVILGISELNADERSKVALAIQYSMGGEMMFWEANAENLPASLFVRVEKVRKCLELAWSPIIDANQRVSRVLISVRDVTDALKFRQQAEEGQNRLKYLGELIKLGPERFHRFEDLFDDHWDKIQTDFAELSTQAQERAQFQRKLFQELHTLKAVARTFQMSGMTHVVHEAEEFLVHKSQIFKQDLSVVADHLQAVVCCITDYQKALKPLLEMRNSLTAPNEAPAAEKARDTSFGALLSGLQAQFDQAARDKGRQPCHILTEVPAELELGEDLSRALSKALVHMVSNSIDHGLEAPDVRLAHGKTAAGVLSFFIDAQGRLAIKDDGQGIQLDRVEAKAAAKGLHGLSREQLLELLFDHGFSTRSAADHSSGRGVGLDAARSYLEEAKSSLVIVPLHEQERKLSFYFAITLPEAARQHVA